MGTALGGFDDGADIGEELDRPLGAVCDFAEHRAGTQCALGAAVRRGKVAVRYEDEEILSRPLDDTLHFNASLAAGARRVRCEDVNRGVGSRPPIGVHA